MKLAHDKSIMNKKIQKLNVKTKKILKSPLIVRIHQVSLVLQEIEKFPFASVK